MTNEKMYQVQRQREREDFRDISNKVADCFGQPRLADEELFKMADAFLDLRLAVAKARENPSFHDDAWVTECRLQYARDWHTGAEAIQKAALQFVQSNPPEHPTHALFNSIMRGRRFKPVFPQPGSVAA